MTDASASSLASLSLPAPAPDALHLRIKTLDDRVFPVVAARSMSVSDFRLEVARLTSVEVPRQRLIYRGKLLKDGVTLAAYDVQDGHTVQLVAKPVPRGSSPVAVAPALDAVRPPVDGPAWNLATLRSALRRTGSVDDSVRHEAGDETAQSVDLEPVAQSLMTVRTVLSTALFEPRTRTTRTTDGREMRRFFVGQWLDVKDTVNQWLESTVLALADEKVLVHYHGWPTRWDEWIDVNSDRLAAFRTRTLHIRNGAHMSPIPTARVPSAPQVGGSDVRRTIADVRNVMREMMPHIDRLADLCEEELMQTTRVQEVEVEEIDGNEDDVQHEAVDSSLTEEDGQVRENAVSEAAHLVSPLFDRFGRLLMDSVQLLDPLLRPELRGTSQRQQERRAIALRRSRGDLAPRQNESVSVSMETHDNTLSIRDLIATSTSAGSEVNQPRRSIDVHIHAIVAPVSLSSLASLTRSSNDAGTTSDSSSLSRSAPAPSLPHIGRSFGMNDSVNNTRNAGTPASDDESDQSRVPLLGSYRHRSQLQVNNHSEQQQRSVARDLDDFLSNDFFGTSFGNNDDNSDNDSSISYAHSDNMESGRSAYRPPSPLERMPSPRTSRNDDSSEDRSDMTGGVLDERLRARSSETPRESNEDSHGGGNDRARRASAGSSSSTLSAGFPTFLDVVRRTLSGVRSFVQSESGSSPENASNSQDGVSGYSLPSSSSPPSSSSSLSTPSESPVVHSSSEIITTSYHHRSSESRTDEELDLDEVD